MSSVVGIDLVDVDDVAESLRTHGERYLRRIYDEQERRECAGSARRLAARFAAKEAAIKALRADDQGLPWRTIVVRVGASGAPTLELTGAADTLARRRGVRRLTLSLADTRRAAMAVVVAELADSER